MISVKLPSGFTKAKDIMTGIANSATGAAVSTTALVNGGAGTLTLAQAETALIITPAQRAQLEGGLTAFGAPITVTIATADAIFKGAALKYTQTATLVSDQEADATQTGSGVTPIFSLNYSPSENLNIAIKYEGATKLLLQNSTTKDLLVGYTATNAPITMFPDGEMTASDMPAMIAVGVDFKPADNFKISVGSNYFFDKSADYGHKLDLDNNSATPATPVKNSYIIDHNGFSLQGGVEFNITDKLLISGGYVWANKGVNDNYQSDLTYAQGSQTFGFGGAFSVMENLQINVGVSLTTYKDAERYATRVFSGTGAIFSPRETYYKRTSLFGIGVDYSF